MPNPNPPSGANTINIDGKSIANAAKTVYGIDQKLKKFATPATSIISKASKSILQFPIYITKSIRINEAQVIGKTFERYYASLVQAALAQHPIIDQEDANGMKFLRQFHINIDSSGYGTKLNPLTTTNDMYPARPVPHTESAIDEADGFIIESLHNVIEINDNLILECNAFAPTKEMAFFISESMRLANPPLTGFSYLEAAPPKKNVVKEVKPQPSPSVLKDVEIKKWNSLTPYAITATFKIRNGKEIRDAVTYVIGVKTVLHPVELKDLNDDLEDIVNGSNRKLQKVRYTSGEISGKDYFLNLSNIKKNASRALKKTNAWLSTLKQLADYQKLSGTIINAHGKTLPIPNGTMVLSQADVIYLRDNTGIDLNDINTTAKFCNSLFLIALTIVDEVAGTMKMYFDRNVDWDVQSIASLDAEIQKQDNSRISSELSKMINR